MLFTAEQLKVLNQDLRIKKIRLEICNYQNKILDTIEGGCLGGSISLNGSSLYRRSCTIPILVNDLYSNIITDKYKVDRGGLIWLDKYIKIYIGIQDLHSEEYVWYNAGGYLIDSSENSFTLTENELDITGNDLMLRWSSDRNGQLANLETQIPAYYTIGDVKYKQTVRGALISVIQKYTDIDNYFIASIPETNKYLPEDIIFEAGATVNDIFEKLLTYLPGWEIYYDTDCVLNIVPIPNGDNDIIYPLDSQNSSAEKISIDFSKIKNHIVIYGKTHETQYYVENTEGETPNISVTGTTLNLNIANFNPSSDYLNDNLLIEFKWLDNQYSPLLNALSISYIDDTGQSQIYTAPLYNFENADINNLNQLNAGAFIPGAIIVIRYRSVNETAPYWDFLSNYQANSCVVQDNKKSAYYINAELVEENYYGGTAISNSGDNYIVTLNNSFAINTLKPDTKITFMANITNQEFATLSLIDSVSGTTILNSAPIEKNGVGISSGEFGGDYTVWLFTYKLRTDLISGTLVPYIVFEGRFPTLTYYLEGGEYENIYSNELARQRANYELYLHSNLNDSINISIIPVYYLDVNKKIHYSNSKLGIDGYYLTKSITIPLSADGQYMDVNAITIN